MPHFSPWRRKLGLQVALESTVTMVTEALPFSSKFYSVLEFTFLRSLHGLLIVLCCCPGHTGEPEVRMPQLNSTGLFLYLVREDESSWKGKLQGHQRVFSPTLWLFHSVWGFLPPESEGENKGWVSKKQYCLLIRSLVVFSKMWIKLRVVSQEDH